MIGKNISEKIINNELFQAAIDAVPTMIAVKNLKGTYIITNKAVDNYYKDKFDTIVGLHVKDVYGEDESKIVLALDSEVIKTCVPIRRTIQVYTKDGYIFVDLSRAPVLDKDNNIVAIISVGHDVTEKETLRKKLLKQNIELDELSKKYKELAHIDELTKIKNRRKFYLDLKSMIIDETYILILTDLNYFKFINDEFGHDFGDKVLFEFAQYTEKLFKEYNGECYRLSGDEFAMLLPYNKTFEIKKEMHKINEFLLNYHPKLSISYGHIEINNNMDRDNAYVNLTIKRADELLYSYKKNFKSKRAL